VTVGTKSLLYLSRLGPGFLGGHLLDIRFDGPGKEHIDSSTPISTFSIIAHYRCSHDPFVVPQECGQIGKKELSKNPSLRTIVGSLQSVDRDDTKSEDELVWSALLFI